MLLRGFSWRHQNAQEFVGLGSDKLLMQDRLHEYGRKMLRKTSVPACSRAFGRARAVVNLGYIKNRRAVLLLAACRMLSPTGY